MFPAKRLATVAIAACMAGCQGGGAIDAQAPRDPRDMVSTDYRDAIARSVKETIKDPYSIRSAVIAQPSMGFIGLLRGGTGPVVCFKFNAKNSFGAYVGVKTYAALFVRSRFDGYFEGDLACGQVNDYAPFPELGAAG